MAMKKLKLSEHPLEKVTHKVGILVPVAGSLDPYGPEHIDFLRTEISRVGFDPVILDWPAVLTPNWIGQVNTLDWMVLDIGHESMSTGAIGYLHGAFKPAMRLLKVNGRPGE
jgi:hypothetical protein